LGGPVAADARIAVYIVADAVDAGSTESDHLCSTSSAAQHSNIGGVDLLRTSDGEYAWLAS